MTPAIDREIDALVEQVRRIGWHVKRIYLSEKEFEEARSLLKEARPSINGRWNKTFKLAGPLSDVEVFCSRIGSQIEGAIVNFAKAMNDAFGAFSIKKIVLSEEAYEQIKTDLGLRFRGELDSPNGPIDLERESDQVYTY